MALIRWILGFLLAILITAFAVFNRQNVDVFWNPGVGPLNAPLYLIALTAMAIGFLVGGVMVWINNYQFRVSTRQQRRHIKKLEKELEEAENAEAPAKPAAAKFLSKLGGTR